MARYVLVLFALGAVACAGELKQATATATTQILLDVRGAKAQMAECRSGNAQTCDDAASRLQSIETTALNLQNMASK